MQPAVLSAALAVTLAAAALWPQPAAAETVAGEPQSLGKGSAWFYAKLAADDTPLELGIGFGESLLNGLPSEPNSTSRCFDRNGNGRIDPHGECNGDYELAFLLPPELTQRLRTPFKWIAVNWNPAGHPHPAPPVWAVPHFDFHFYTQEREAVRAIRPGACSELIDCDDFKRAQLPVPAKYLHADHIDVGAAVPDMGNHLIDSKSPELQPGGPPFTHTFIYGAYDGRVTFFEPMITLAFLAIRPDVCVDLKQPQAWPASGYYPTRYCIRYLAGEAGYAVSLDGFVYRDDS